VLSSVAERCGLKHGFLKLCSIQEVVDSFLEKLHSFFLIDCLMVQIAIGDLIPRVGHFFEVQNLEFPRGIGQKVSLSF